MVDASSGGRNNLQVDRVTERRWIMPFMFQSLLVALASALVFIAWACVHHRLRPFSPMPGCRPRFALNERYQFVFELDEDVLRSSRAYQVVIERLLWCGFHVKKTTATEIEFGHGWTSGGFDVRKHYLVLIVDLPLSHETRARIRGRCASLSNGDLWQYVIDIKDHVETAKARCQICGYRLRGNVSGVCPECGWNLAEVKRPRAKVTSLLKRFKSLAGNALDAK
jgi:hypothetical protein